MHAQAVKRQGGESDAKHEPQPKPPRLPKSWGYSKPHGSFSAVPQPVTVRSDDAKPVGARAKIRVYGGSCRRRIAPIMVKSVQPISVPNTLGAGKTQPGVAEHDPLVSRRKADWTIDRIAIYGDGLYLNQRRHRAAGCLIRVHNGKPTIHGEPNFPHGVGKYGPMSLYAFGPKQSIGEPILAHIGVTRSIAQQPVPPHAEDMIRGCEPPPSIFVFRDSEYLLAQRYRYVERNLNM